MQAQIPQYIEVEDKIIGPFTLRQFLYLLGGLIVLGVLWVLFQPIVVILLGPVVMAFAGAAAFYKVNGRPFLSYVTAFLKHSATSNRYTWQHTTEGTKTVQRSQQTISVPKKGGETLPPSARRQREQNLFDVAWQMDVGKQQNNNEVEPPNNKSSKP